MSNAIRRVVFVAASLGLAAAGASAQQPGVHAGVAPWAMQQAAAAADPNATLSTFTGSFVLNFSISIKSIIPSSFPIQCNASLTPSDIGSGYFYVEQKTVYATRSGNTATCSVTVPYSWQLSSASTPVSTTFMIMTEGTGSSLLNRVSTGNLPSVTLPANATTLTRAIAITI